MAGEELNPLYANLEGSSNFRVQPSTPLISVDSLSSSQNYNISPNLNWGTLTNPPPPLSQPNSVVVIPQTQTTENQDPNSIAEAEQASSLRGKNNGKKTWYKGPWTTYEDRKLMGLVGLCRGKWSDVAKYMSGRTGKQCRERYHNNLRPDISKSPGWSDEEEMKIIEGHERLGNRWSEIARLYVPGRSENALKNHWNAITRKQLSTKRIARPARKRHFYQSNLLENYIRSKFFTPSPAAAPPSPPVAADVPLSIDDYDVDEVPFFSFEIADLMHSLYADDDTAAGSLPPTTPDADNGASTSATVGEEMSFLIEESGTVRSSFIS